MNNIVLARHTCDVVHEKKTTTIISFKNFQNTTFSEYEQGLNVYKKVCLSLEANLARLKNQKKLGRFLPLNVYYFNLC